MKLCPSGKSEAVFAALSTRLPHLLASPLAESWNAAPALDQETHTGRSVTGYLAVRANVLCCLQMLHNSTQDVGFQIDLSSEAKLTSKQRYRLKLGSLQE